MQSHMDLTRLLAWIAILAILGTGAAASAAERKLTAVIKGLDHVPVAVEDLEQAANRFRAFGFVIKPGRPHDNGIRNQHVKFPDGSGIECCPDP